MTTPANRCGVTRCALFFIDIVASFRNFAFCRGLFEAPWRAPSRSWRSWRAFPSAPCFGEFREDRAFPVSLMSVHWSCPFHEPGINEYCPRERWAARREKEKEKKKDRKRRRSRSFVASLLRMTTRSAGFKTREFLGEGCATRLSAGLRVARIGCEHSVQVLEICFDVAEYIQSR